MEFKNFHKEYFGAISGAYSKVTMTEFYDSQITLTDVEAQTVIDHFGRVNIHVGNVGSNRIKSGKQFLLYANQTTIILNLVFPKPFKTELRIYLSKSAGYKPAAGDIWFVYENTSGELVIGSMSESIWNNLGQSDDLDEDYLNAVEEKLSITPLIIEIPAGQIREVPRSGGLTYLRNPLIAIARLNAVKYTCENNIAHSTFTAQRTNLPYMEAHHFIPMKFQPLFQTPLDNFENIFCLCPNCHRAIHHAIADQKYDLVYNLYQKRPVLQDQYSFEDIAQYYNCLKLPEA